MTLLNQARAQAIMKGAGVDALIATSPTNVAYMSDYSCISHRLNPGLQVYGVLSANGLADAALVIPSLEIDSWAEYPGEIKHIYPYGTLYRNRGDAATLSPADTRIFENVMARETKADALDGLCTALQARGLTEATLGVDESNLQPDVWDAIQNAFPQAKFVKSAALWREIRLIKTESEIERLTKSAEITEDGIRYAFARVREGTTEREIANAFNARVSELSGEPTFWVVSVGSRTGHTHSRQSDTAVKRGDMIKLDVGCIYNLYWSDVGRTKTYGELDSKAAKIYEILCAGLRAAISKARPGVYASEVFDIAVETIRGMGLKDYQRHHCGHGIGINVYDFPLIQPRGYADIYRMGGTDQLLEEGMVINLETPYYLIGDYGFIVEETLVIREKGPQLLTAMDHSFAIAN